MSDGEPKSDTIHAAVILCGGLSKRMGQDKNWLQLPSPPAETMLQRLCRTTASVVGADRLVLVSAVDQRLPELSPETIIVADDMPQAGPLAGLTRGLQECAVRFGADAAVFVTACDTPLLKPEVIGWLLSQLSTSDAVALQDGSHLYPLLAVYRAVLFHTAMDLLQNGERRARALVENTASRLVPSTALHDCDPDLVSLKNVNTPAAYREICRLLESSEQ